MICDGIILCGINNFTYMNLNKCFGNLSHSFQAVPELVCSLDVFVSLLFSPNKIFLSESLKKVDCIVTD